LDATPVHSFLLRQCTLLSDVELSLTSILNKDLVQFSQASQVYFPLSSFPHHPGHRAIYFFFSLAECAISCGAIRSMPLILLMVCFPPQGPHGPFFLPHSIVVSHLPHLCKPIAAGLPVSYTSFFMALQLNALSFQGSRTFPTFRAQRESLSFT